MPNPSQAILQTIYPIDRNSHFMYAKWPLQTNFIRNLVVNTCHINAIGKQEVGLTLHTIQLRCLYGQAIDFHDGRHKTQ